VRKKVVWPALVFILLTLFIANISTGSTVIPTTILLKILTFQDQQSVYADIIWNFRITKAFTCILAGSALALGGLQMQTLFRNPLVGPDVLGLTSGASLAVALILMSNAAGLGELALHSPSVTAVGATIGCILVFLIMLALSRKLQDNVSLLIVGLMIGAGTASIVSVLQYLSSADEMQIYIIWTFGSLGTLNWNEIKILGIVLLIGTAIAVVNVRSLNTWLMGDNYARSMGIDVKAARFWSILSASILTGGVTAFCGPIAFVGLAVPHLVRVLAPTNNHQVQIPAVLLGGASLLLFCDIVTQLPGSSHILPINAITALIGAPVVISVILRSRISRI
jgi:iron complex transport system permease protein